MDQPIEIQPVFTQEPVVPEPLKKSFSKWPFIILFAFILGAASVFAYQRFQPTRTVPVGQSPVVSPEPAADPTAGWQVYTISYNGLNFKYPAEQRVFADINDRTALAADKLYMIGYPGTDQMSLKIYLYKSEMTPLDWWNVKGKNKFEKLAEGGKLNNPPQMINLSYQEENITFAGKQALQVTVFSNFETPHTPKENNLIIFKNQGYITMVVYSQSFEKSIEISRQILSTFKFTENQNQLISCSSVNLNLFLNLPNLSWNCEVDNMGKEEKDWDGSIRLSSPIFSIEISSLGRGPYCGDGPQDSNHICTTTPNFIYTPNFALTKFVYDQETKELFGGFNQALQLRPWISVTYKDMSQRELTQNEKNELIKLLDSVEIIN